MRTGKLSTNTAAIHYKVPRRTVRAYFAENKHSKSKLGRKTIFSSQQEKELSRKTVRLAQTGYHVTLQGTENVCVRML
jgi:hypothetical protein